MRRLGLAITFALNAPYLLLDEPLSGLDPRGRSEVMAALSDYVRLREAAVVLVSHNMNDVARIADRLVVLDHGSILMEGTPAEVFRQEDQLAAAGLELPDAYRLLAFLRRQGMPLPDAFTPDTQTAYHILREFLQAK